MGFMACFMICGCGNQANRSAKQKDTPTMQASEQKDKESFPFPEIPTMITTPEERRAFLLEHFWDRFDFSDTTIVNNRDISEQGFANQIALFADSSVTQELISSSIAQLCSGMEKQGHSRNVFMDLFDDYLFDPNSPYHNEAIYAVYLQRMLQSNYLSEAEKSRLDFRLKLISRNRPGEEATSFTYYLPDGKSSTLAQTKVKGKYLLLVFYDPECPSCHKILLEMTQDATLDKAVSDGRLSVLAIYTEGDEDVWLRTLPEIPKTWTAGNDRMGIKDGALYDLKAMPSIYLLDSHKRVVLKDASFKQVLNKLNGE